jgi:hypothetical protein
MKDIVKITDDTVKDVKGFGASISYLIIGVLMSLSCYYLDQARGAAFVIVPGITLKLILVELGIKGAEYKKQRILIWSIFFVYAILMEMYLVFNPILRS